MQNALSKNFTAEKQMIYFLSKKYLFLLNKKNIL